MFVVQLLLLLTSTEAGSITFQGASSTSPYALNPHRGFRMQIDNSCLQGNEGQQSLLQGLEACKSFNLTTTLFYCYLTRFWNVTELPASFLSDLNLRFATLRQHGVSAILNFGYEDGKSFDKDVEPYTYKLIRRHIAQLTPIVQANGDVIQSLQAGFLGNAGEWAHDIHNLTKNCSGLAGMLAKEIYELVPPSRFVLIRRGLEKMEWVLSESPVPPTTGYATWEQGVVDASTAHTNVPYSRMGYYNAGFLSTITDGGSFDPPIDSRNKWFQYMSYESPYVAVDGEMYYGTPWPSKGRLLVDGHAAALRMVRVAAVVAKFLLLLLRLFCGVFFSSFFLNSHIMHFEFILTSLSFSIIFHFYLLVYISIFIF